MENVNRIQEKLFLIERLPLFCDLSSDERLRIASVSVLVEYKKGDVIYKENDAPDAFYCVITGRIKIYLPRPGGHDDVLEYLKLGKYFGIISLLTKEPHSVSAMAVNDSIVLKIPREDFDAIIGDIPRLALHLSQSLSRRLRHKDILDRKVFESVIVAVYGIIDKPGAAGYALNLSASLRRETKKGVVLIEVREVEAEPIKEGLTLRTPFFKKEDLEGAISRYPEGADIVKVAFHLGDAIEAAALTSLVSYLTSDYNYIIVDLPACMDKTLVEIIKQVDCAHVITPSERPALEATRQILDELRMAPFWKDDSLQVITTESASVRAIPFKERREILGCRIFATLPDQKSGDYAKAVRRVAREVGGVRVGLALGSGAALGLAHVGVLKALESEEIPIDVLVGTSIGALIGALWVSGKSISDMEAVIYAFRSKLANIKLMDFAFPRRGILKGIVIRNFLKKHLGDKTFYDVKLPFKVVACDIQTRQEVVIDRGPLVDAVLASISIPGVFEPVMLDGRILVDGGIINPLPTNVLTRVGIDRIIAVNALPSPEDVVISKKKVMNIFDIIVNSVQASEYLLAQISGQSADVCIHPIIQSMDWYEFFKGSDAVARGEEEARKFLPAIKDLVTQ